MSSNVPCLRIVIQKQMIDVIIKHNTKKGILFNTGGTEVFHSI